MQTSPRSIRALRKTVPKLKKRLKEIETRIRRSIREL